MIFDLKSGLWVPRRRLCSLFPAVHGIAGAAGSIPYAADGIRFNQATPDYATRGADLTGNANSKLFSCSFWIKRIAVIGTNEVIYWLTVPGDSIQFRGDDTIRIRFFDTTPAVVLEVNSSAISDTNWHHVMASFDMADTGKRHLYVDGSSDLATIVTYTNATIDFTQADHSIGARDDGGSQIDACIADLWIAHGQYIDLSVAGNRAQFYNSGSPVNLGSDGSTPTGTAPLMFFSGAVASWHTNKGSGGGFTEQGTFADCASDP